MWRIIIPATVLCILLVVESRPMEPLEGTFWSDAASEAMSLRSHPEMFRQQRNFPEETYNSDYELELPQPPNDKRALAMIARWTPFSNLGKQRSPIRTSIVDPESIINTQTRGRMVGQPLRWG